MKVLANRYLYKFREMFPEDAEVHLFTPGSLPENTAEYDALFINTTTPINASTLPERGNIRFIATGSSGTDHMDLNYLEKIGIQTADAAGCNASAVAEYVCTSLLCLQEKSDLRLHDLNVGIVGVGHVGSEVSRLLTRFSIPNINYDPPRSNREPRFTSAHFEEIKECDILTFHTPLSHSGNYPTHHLLNRSWFRGANYKLILNTARGGVVDEQLIMEELEIGRLKNTIIDVWEHEPDFNIRLSNKALFATPHIAGYSLQSKQRASEMIIQEFCRFTGLQTPAFDPQPDWYPDLKENYQSLSELLTDLHPIQWFTEQMRKMAENAPEKRGEHFARLRSESDLRHEYTHIRLSEHLIDQFPELTLLGIQPS